MLLFSETCYTPLATRDTAGLIRKCLKTNGVAVVAGKNFYFGVGGGVNLLKDELGRVGVKVLEKEGWKWNNGEVSWGALGNGTECAFTTFSSVTPTLFSIVSLRSSPRTHSLLSSQSNVREIIVCTLEGT